MEKTFYKFIGSHVGNAIGSILLCLFFYKAFAPYGTFAIWVCSIFVAIYLWMLNAPKYRWNEKNICCFSLY